MTFFEKEKNLVESRTSTASAAPSHVNLLGVLSELKGDNFDNPCDAASLAKLVDSANPNWNHQLTECTTAISETPKLAASEKEAALFAFVEEAAKLQKGNSIEIQRNGNKTVGYQIYPNYEMRANKSSASPQSQDAASEDPAKVRAEIQRAYPPPKEELDYLSEIREESARIKAELERENPPTKEEADYAREIREESAKTRKELEAQSKFQ